MKRYVCTVLMYVGSRNPQAVPAGKGKKGSCEGTTGQVRRNYSEVRQEISSAEIDGGEISVPLYACMHVCMYVCMEACYVYVCMYVCMYLYSRYIFYSLNTDDIKTLA